MMKCEPWKYRLNTDAEASAFDETVHWDYQTKLGFQGTIQADLSAIREECGLPPNWPLSLFVQIDCRESRYQHVAWHSDPAAGDSFAEEISFKIDSTKLRGKIQIETRLVLGESCIENDDLLAPRQEYSSLIEHREVLILEGTGSRFPTIARKFEDIPAFESFRFAPWHLDADLTDLDAPFNGKVQLILNESQTLTYGSLVDNEQPAVSMLSFSIANDLIRRALSDDAFMERASEEDGFVADSVGSQLMKMMWNCFPGKSLDAIRSMSRNEPERFSAEIYSAAMRTTGGDR